MGSIPVPPMQGTPLTVACYKGHVAIVKLLLEAGADADKVDDEVRGYKHITFFFKAVDTQFM
jgi:ankyrin repeat protein